MTNLIKFPDIEGAMVSCATVCTLHIGPLHHIIAYIGPMAWRNVAAEWANIGLHRHAKLGHHISLWPIGHFDSYSEEDHEDHEATLGLNRS